MPKFANYIKFAVLLYIISGYSASQEISITIDTLNIEYGVNSITIPYKLKNLTGSDIVFLDKKEFISLTWCYKISNTKTFYEYDSSRTADDFITLKPGEEAEQKAVIYLYWPCRSMPKGLVYIYYYADIKNDDNYYNYLSGEGVNEMIHINAWTGEIKSSSFQISDK